MRRGVLVVQQRPRWVPWLGVWFLPGTALAAVAADRLTVAVALLDDQADVGLHQLGDVHDLQREGSLIQSAAFQLADPGNRGGGKRVPTICVSKTSSRPSTAIL